MPTPSERRALVFLAAISVLGAGVRAIRAGRSPGPMAPDSGSRAALERQIALVDSARRTPRLSRRTRPRRSGEFAADDPARPSRFPSGYPIPRSPGESARLDLDIATVEEIERLPRIGPALAKRIVADRDSLGPFGSSEGWQRVRGVGPALARALADRVTFSGFPRPSHVGERVTGRERPGGRARPDARAPP